MRRNWLKIFVVSAAVAVLAVVSPGAVVAAPVTRSLTPDRMFQYGPPVRDTAIQVFDMGPGGDVYFTQREGKDTRLSRCARAATTCGQRDSVLLKGFGHGESLEVFSRSGKVYALVGSRAAGDSPYFSTTVSLIEYVKGANGSKTATAKTLGTATGLAAVVPGKTGNSLRAAVALADGADRLAIRAQVAPGGSNSYYGVYKAQPFIDKLKSLKGGSVSLASLKSQLVSHFKEPGRPHGSFQGFDIKGVGSGQKYLYVFGGGGGAQKPTIYRFSYTNGGNTVHDRTYVIKGGYVGTLESEGVKVESDPAAGGRERVMLGLKPTGKDSHGRLEFRLYHFAE